MGRYEFKVCFSSGCSKCSVRTSVALQRYRLNLLWEIVNDFRFPDGQRLP